MKLLNLKILLIATFITFSAVVSNAAEPAKNVAAEKEIHKTLENWLKAVTSGGPDAVEKLYEKDAVLLPTLSNKVHNTPELRREYFVYFTATPNLKGKITEEHIRVYGDTAINSGLYTFSFTKDGKPTEIPARYSFVYRKTPAGWLIVDHHSSDLPLAQ